MSSTCSSLASAGALAAALSGCAQRPPPTIVSDDPVEAKLLNARHGNTLVRCRPADAAVFVDGVEQGLASDFDGTLRLLTLPRGLHRVVFQRKGYEPVEVTTSAGDGRQTLDVTLVPLSVQSQPLPAREN